MPNPEGPDHLCSIRTLPGFGEVLHLAFPNPQLVRNASIPIHRRSTDVRLPFTGQAQEVQRCPTQGR